MIQGAALASVILVALIHCVFVVIEATRWNTEFGRGLSHLSEPSAAETVGLGRNMALYNGFLGFLLIWGTFALSIRQAYSLQWLVLSFIVVAGVVGWRTMKSPRIALAQSVPALLALGLIWAARPYPRTEAEAIPEIIAIERQILAMKSVDIAAKGGAVPRGQHPKMHGLVRAELTVADDLPKDLRVGLFATPGRPYKALVRFSNARNTDDQEKGGHGMAIKLTEDDGATTTQDFVLFDAPAFFVGDPLQYVEFEEATLRGFGRSKPATLATLFLDYYAWHPRHFLNLVKTQRGDVTDPLAIRYWSVTPYSLGGKPVKYTVRPAAEAGPAVVPRSADMLREAMKAHLAARDAIFEFQIQTQTDAASMPVEDPTRAWDEAASPPRTVARLTIPSGQVFDTDERKRLAEHLEFTPWHTLPEHEPLGGINRVRKAVYDSLAEFRRDLNHDLRGGTPK